MIWVKVFGIIGIVLIGVGFVLEIVGGVLHEKTDKDKHFRLMGFGFGLVLSVCTAFLLILSGIAIISLP